jgi:hypothetical protein
MWEHRGRVSVGAGLVRVSVPGWMGRPSVAVSVPGDPAVHAATRGAVLRAVVTEPGPVAALVVVWRAVAWRPVVGGAAGGQAGLGGRRGGLWLEGELYLRLEPGRVRGGGRSVAGRRWRGVVELALLWGRRGRPLGRTLAAQGRRRAFCRRRHCSTLFGEQVLKAFSC